MGAVAETWTVLEMPAMKVAPTLQLPISGQPVMTAGAAGVTLKVNCCSTEPELLDAMIPQLPPLGLMQEVGPLKGDVQVPLMVAVPLWLSVNVSPPRFSSLSMERLGVGCPVATTVNGVMGIPAPTLIEFADMIASVSVTLSEKVCCTLPELDDAVRTSVKFPWAKGFPSNCSWKVPLPPVILKSDGRLPLVKLMLGVGLPTAVIVCVDAMHGAKENVVGPVNTGTVKTERETCWMLPFPSFKGMVLDT